MKVQAVRVTLVAATLLTGQVATAQSEFTATLTGASQVPAVTTSAFGTATFDLNLSASELGVNFELTAINTPRAFMAHIHCGGVGENGPVVVWLAGNHDGSGGHDINGSWIGDAKFTDANIVSGSACGDTLADLIDAMIAGRTYVNVHTEGNPGGEIRGQIVPVAPFTVP